MADEVPVNSAVDATRVPVRLDPLPVELVESGSPSTGSVELLKFGDTLVGIWEHSPGVSTDVENAEAFVVLSGRATVEFLDSGAVMELVPGSVGYLAAGARTRWTITETLRKIYIA